MGNKTFLVAAVIVSVRIVAGFADYDGRGTHITDASRQIPRVSTLWTTPDRYGFRQQYVLQFGQHVAARCPLIVTPV